MSKLTSAQSGEWLDELLVPGPPRGVRYDWTSDGAHVVSLEDAGRGLVRIGWDGRASEPFELKPQRSGDPFEWSPGALHVAWYGLRGDQIFVAVDGVEYPCEGVTRSVPPTFSDAGDHVAYGVYVSGVPRLMVDGRLLDEWQPAPRRPVFSPDGAHLAFVAESRALVAGESERGYRQWVVLDGVAQPEAAGIGQDEDDVAVLFSPDSRRLAYRQLEGGNVRLVVDGIESDAYPQVEFPTFSPDSRRVVCAAGRKDSMSLVLDGVASGKAYQWIGQPVFSPDASRLGFFGVRSKGRAVAVVDGVEGPEFNDAWGDLAFSGDSRHVAYLAMHKSGGLFSRSTTARLVRDDAEGTRWDEVGSRPHFSPDDAHVAFSGRRGDHWHAIVDDEPGPAFANVGPPRFSSAGRLAYLALERVGRGQEQYRVVVDGIEPPIMTEPSWMETAESFVFSPDGEHVATAGQIGDSWHPIVDETVGPGGTGAGSVRFDGDVASFLVAGEDGAHRVSTRMPTR